MIATHPLKGNKAVEHRLHSAVVEVLHRECLPSWRYTYMEAQGWPTFLLIGPRKTCFLQLKLSTGTINAELASHIMMCGCGYGYAFDVDDAVSMLKDWGCVSPDAEPVRL